MYKDLSATCPRRELIAQFSTGLDQLQGSPEHCVFSPGLYDKSTMMEMRR